MVRNLRFIDSQDVRNNDIDKLSVIQDKYRALIENSPLAIVVLNLKGNILDINDKIWDWLGYRPEEVIGKHFGSLPFLPLRSKLKIITNLSRRLKEKDIPPYELDFTTAEGESRTGLVSVSKFSNGKNTYLLANISDLTQLKKAEYDLGVQQHQFSTIFSSAPDMLALIDTNLVYHEVNEAFANFLNLSTEDIIGKTDFNLFPKKLAQHNRERAIFAFEEKTPQHSVEEIQDLIGQNRHFQTVRSIYCDNNNEPIGLLISMRDITEERNAGKELHDYKGRLEKLISVRTNQLEKQNKELRIAKSKAEESEKLKTAFLSNISHEIRTPMNAIIGFAELLRDVKSEDPKNHYIDIINEKSQVLLGIFNNIIDLSKLQANDLEIKEEDVNINLLAEDLFLTFKESKDILNNGQISVNLIKGSKEEIHAKTDPYRLKQILSSLLDNAFKFTLSGSISLKYSISEINNQTMLSFKVKDTGVGIPADKQSLIFDHFRQADDSNTRQFGGSGLGLSIAKNLIELMNGEISFTSTEGQGSEFTVYIPYKEATHSETSVKNFLSENKADWSGKTILITEDNPTSFMLLKSMLRPTGATILHANNGKDSVKLCKSTDKIDVVLMDIQMPVMNGFDATRAIKKDNPNIPVIAQTAYTLQGEREKCLTAGCDEYLSKPIYSELLFKTLNKFL